MDKSEQARNTVS